MSPRMDEYTPEQLLKAAKARMREGTPNALTDAVRIVQSIKVENTYDNFLATARDDRGIRDVAEIMREQIFNYECRLDVLAGRASSADHQQLAASLKQLHDDARSFFGSYGIPLHDAAWAGDTERVRTLIAEGVKVDARRGKTGDTPLHLAAQHANTEVTAALIESGADVNATSYSHYTPLHWAVQQKHLEQAALLIKNGANIDASDRGITPIELAVSNRDTKMVALLIKNGADANPAVGGMDFKFIRKTNPEIVETLIKGGAYIPGDRAPTQAELEAMTPGQKDSYLMASALKKESPRGTSKKTAGKKLAGWAAATAIGFGIGGRANANANAAIQPAPDNVPAQRQPAEPDGDKLPQDHPQAVFGRESRDDWAAALEAERNAEQPFSRGAGEDSSGRTKGKNAPLSSQLRRH